MKPSIASRMFKVTEPVVTAWRVSHTEPPWYNKVFKFLTGKTYKRPQDNWNVIVCFYIDKTVDLAVGDIIAFHKYNALSHSFLVTNMYGGDTGLTDVTVKCVSSIFTEPKTNDFFGDTVCVLSHSYKENQ